MYKFYLINDIKIFIIENFVWNVKYKLVIKLKKR